MGCNAAVFPLDIYPFVLLPFLVSGRLSDTRNNGFGCFSFSDTVQQRRLHNSCSVGEALAPYLQLNSMSEKDQGGNKRKPVNPEAAL
jgi:hypothetical protein